MTKIVKYTLEFGNLYYRSGSYEAEQKQYYYEILSTIQETLGSFSFKRDEMPVHINLDWSIAIEDYERNLRNNFFMNDISDAFRKEMEEYKPVEEFFEEIEKRIPHKTKILIEMSINTDSRKIIDQVIKNFVYHLFLILNLSCPGFLNLYYASLTSAESSIRLTLSNSPLLECWADKTWPAVRFIPLMTVRNWYEELDLFSKYVGQSRIDKALFSLLYFCEESKVNPSKIVWLAHAIEAIYELSHSAIIHTLKERIATVLINDEKNESSRKSITKKINKFYQYRSDFVHGTLNMVIPSEDILEMDGHSEYVEELFQTEEFTFKLLIASIQKLIGEGWEEYNFKTIFVGKEIQFD